MQHLCASKRRALPEGSCICRAWVVSKLTGVKFLRMSWMPPTRSQAAWRYETEEERAANRGNRIHRRLGHMVHCPPYLPSHTQRHSVHIPSRPCTCDHLLPRKDAGPTCSAGRNCQGCHRWQRSKPAQTEKSQYDATSTGRYQASKQQLLSGALAKNWELYSEELKT